MSDLSKMKKAELLEFAAANGVDSVSKDMTNADIISVINEVVEAEAEPEVETEVEVVEEVEKPEPATFDIDRAVRHASKTRGRQFANGFRAGYEAANK